MVKICKVFALGTCTRGQTCNYSHEVASSSNLQSTVAPVVPLPHFTMSPVSLAETKRRPCRFHLLGRCSKGVDCNYEHLNENSSNSNTEQKGQSESVKALPMPMHVRDVRDTKIAACTVAAPEHSTRELEARDMRGASVMFGPGAQVHDLEFPSDYSAIQMTSPQPN